MGDNILYIPHFLIVLFWCLWQIQGIFYTELCIAKFLYLKHLRWECIFIGTYGSNVHTHTKDMVIYIFPPHIKGEVRYFDRLGIVAPIDTSRVHANTASKTGSSNDTKC